jgi:hypothetical protein
MNISEHSPHALLLAAIRRVFGAHAAILFMPDETGRFTPACADCADDTLKSSARLEPGKGLAGWILRNWQPLIVNSFDQRGNRIGYYAPDDEKHIRAFMGCPLDTGGILCVDSARAGEFTEEDLKSLYALAALFGRDPVAASPELDDIRRYFTRMERIQELRIQHPQWKRYLPAFLRLVAEATQFDHIAFAVRAEDRNVLVIEAEIPTLLLTETMPGSLPVAGGVVGWVFRNDVPVHAEGMDKTPCAALYGKVKGIPDFRSHICLPVAINKSTAAVLCLGGLEARPIRQSLRSFVRMAVDELVQFLEALYLRHRMRDHLSRAAVHPGTPVQDAPDAPRSVREEES